jgi:hypothetical protein
MHQQAKPLTIMQPAVPLRKERKTQLNAVQNERERTLLPRARIFVQSSQAEIDPTSIYRIISS